MTDLYPPQPVLVVDDEVSSLKAINAVLMINGINNIVLCEDSRLVENMMQERKFTVILLDLSMPHVSGFELLEVIKERHPDTPALVITGQTSVEKAMKCIALGAHDYLLKPVDRHKLLTRLSRAIEYGAVSRENSAMKDLLLSDQLYAGPTAETTQDGAIDFLVRTREEYKSLFESVLAPSFVVDLAAGTCLFCNRAYSEFVDRYGGGCTRKGCFLPSLHERELDAILSECRRQGSVTGKEVKGSFAPGTTYTVILNCRMSEDGEFIQGNFIDVTEQRRLEDQDRRISRLDTLGGAVGRAAHDFRNILTAILGYTELIESEIGTSFLAGSGTILSDLRQIALLVERGNSLAKSLLIGDEELPEKIKPVEVNKILSGVVSSSRAFLRPEIRLETDCDPRCGTVHADPADLEHAMLNIIKNAGEAINGAGEIRVATRSTPESDIQIKVSDTGAGIAPENIKKVFEPFYTTKDRGTGIGLPTVRSFVNSLNGTLDLESSRGRGTTITITIPGSAGCPREQPADAPSSEIRSAAASLDAC